MKIGHKNGLFGAFSVAFSVVFGLIGAGYAQEMNPTAQQAAPKQAQIHENGGFHFTE